MYFKGRLSLRRKKQICIGRRDIFAATTRHRLRLWWESLTDMEQAVPANINTLVSSCEDVIKHEQQAWSSTLVMIGEKYQQEQGLNVETKDDTTVDVSDVTAP